MNDQEQNSYPDNEKSRLKELEILFKDWEEALECSENKMLRENAYKMTRDGFYPYYFRQPTKILFVGRDAYGMSGEDYLGVFHQIYRKTKVYGNN